MKTSKKIALGAITTLSVFSLVACGSSSSSKASGGPTVLKMYQVGQAPDNFKTLMAEANKEIEKKIKRKT